MVINVTSRNRHYRLLILGLATLFLSGLTFSFLAGGRNVATASAELANVSQPQAPLLTPTPSPCGLEWRQVPSIYDVWFEDVAAIAPDNVWAVGSRNVNTLAHIAHWDGVQWTSVTTPNPPGNSNVLFGIDAVSANDIWAVGKLQSTTNVFQPFILHWEGTQWTQVTVPNLPGESWLQSVSVVSANDIWAVGAGPAPGSNYFETFTLHWDGSVWSHVPSPTFSGGSRLLSVHAIASGDVWAVGYSGSYGTENTLSMHWDGTVWNTVSTPNPGNYYTDTLQDVTATSNGDVWAVGFYEVEVDIYTTIYRPLVLHWNGATWTQVQSPLRGEGSHDLSGVVAISANDVWAVGTSYDSIYGQGGPRTLTQHYDGTQWTIVDSPSPPNWNYTVDVDAVASNDVWAVGVYTGQGREALTLHYSDPCITPTPISTSTGTPPTSTPTNTFVPTGTPTPAFTSTATPTCGPLWQRVTSANPSNSNNRLSGVAVVAPNDVWAVGEYNDPGLGGARAHIQHWNGTAWSTVSVPDTSYSGLSAISVVSANDIWAVGFANIGGYYQPMSLHWNGTQWSDVATPRPYPGSHGYLHGVGAISAGDVWAVGDGPNGPLTMHWNGTQWTVVPSPGMGNIYSPGKGDAPGSYNNSLFAVGVVSSNDVWAVGTRNGITWALRWNGTQWNQVSTPNPGNESSLNAITVIAPNDIWAVGHIGFYLDPRGAIALHWNGSQWSSIPPPSGNFGLFGVTHTAPNEVWAVGWEDTGQYSSDALILKWDGSQWTRTPSPNPTYANRDELFATDAAGPNDVWAVGMFDYDTLIDRYYSAPCGTPGPTNTPGPPTAATSTQTHTATGTATGTATSTVPGATNTVVPTTSTTAIASPTACAGLNISGALTLQDPTQAGRLNTLNQASTCADPRNCPGVLDNIPRHYDAYTFRNTSGSEACFTVDIEAECLNNILIHSSTYLGTYDPSNLCQSYLADVGPGILTISQYSFTVPAGQTFVVVVNELAPNLLCPNYTLSVSGPACPVAGTPVPTSTSIIPTGTVPATIPATVTVPATIPATVTVPPIPTTVACNIVFSDVPTNNTFYQQIMCLSCMGFVSGYPDGTFRPDSEITRGQLSKLVSNTAGFRDAPTQQTFADVAEGSTFYMYIERMAQRGVIGGYPCGSLGEPCGEGNKPYFRPSANATRGQISKIVANAANLTDPPTGQAFEDVLPSHPFYQWVQRLAQHGMMNGYACGGVGEPCGTGSRPYFRPANNATRGQVSKIASNSFYPGCAVQ